jgi:hypothetical protein
MTRKAASKMRKEAENIVSDKEKITVDIKKKDPTAPGYLTETARRQAERMKKSETEK